MLAVTKSLADIEAELSRVRKRHKAGANKKLAEAKRIRTAMLKAEVDAGMVHRRACKARKPGQQSALELVAA